VTITNSRTRGRKINPANGHTTWILTNRIMLEHDHDQTGSPTRGITAEPNPLYSWDACEG
jgi:hypothetical protein